MPSFDIVSKTDLAEVDNAINSAMREWNESPCSKTFESLTIGSADKPYYLTGILSPTNYTLAHKKHIKRNIQPMPASCPPRFL